MSPAERAEAMQAAAQAQKESELKDMAMNLTLQEQAAKVDNLKAAALASKATAAKTFTEAGEVTGRVIADINTGEVSGEADVELEAAPDPVVPGASEDRDSTSFQNQGRS
jgi:hypothetical protein